MNRFRTLPRLAAAPPQAVEEAIRVGGLAASKAKAILEARRERGAFKSVEELEEVKGIGKGALERLRPFVTVSGKTTAERR